MDKNVRPCVLTPPMLINEIARLFAECMRMSDVEKLMHKESCRLLFFHLSENNGVSQKELVNLTKMKAPTISVALGELESDGFIRQEQDENDKRIIRIYITEKGRIFQKKVKSALNNVDSIIMDGISDEESKTALKILTKMRDNLLEEIKTKQN